MSTVTNVTKTGDFQLSTRVFLTSHIKVRYIKSLLKIDVREAIQEIQIFENINSDTLTGRLSLSRWCRWIR